MPRTSVIIRTRNEEKWIGSVLKRLMEQDDQDLEVVVVDNGSTDRTLDIVRTFPVKVVQIADQEFTYPRALNLGILNARPSKYIAILSGHSIPYDRSWLSGSIAIFSKFPKVAGVYGPLRPLPGSTFWDKFFMRAWIPPLRHLHRTKIFHRPGMGVLGFTNAVILRDLWEKHPFNESYANGGEDGEWIGYWMEQGYCAVKDWACVVQHSHNLNLEGWRNQWNYWRSLAKPQIFRRLPFRGKGPHAS